MEKLLYIYIYKVDVNYNQVEILLILDKMLFLWKIINFGYNVCVCVYLDVFGGNGSIIITEIYYVDF